MGKPILLLPAARRIANGKMAFASVRAKGKLNTATCKVFTPLRPAIPSQVDRMPDTQKEKMDSLQTIGKLDESIYDPPRGRRPVGSFRSEVHSEEIPGRE